jgi:hypothetical protein
MRRRKRRDATGAKLRAFLLSSAAAFRGLLCVQAQTPVDGASGRAPSIPPTSGAAPGMRPSTSSQAAASTACGVLISPKVTANIWLAILIDELVLTVANHFRPA